MSAQDVLGCGQIINVKFQATPSKSVNMLVEEEEKPSNQQESSSAGHKCHGETSFCLRYFRLHQSDGATDRHRHPRRHISSPAANCASLAEERYPVSKWGVCPSERNN